MRICPCTEQRLRVVGEEGVRFEYVHRRHRRCRDKCKHEKQDLILEDFGTVNAVFKRQQIPEATERNCYVVS